ncbi:substrate-binding periplasmic protein [Desulfopila aestuarii]|uniref:Extracellular solute-binding protein, family 3 n=1 Tax=Desulfopila aestuarii DSM 18488 TaxID=1121416 RepID=A0A1M7Y5M9_9BACT|nr:transporter substrate-binding domain-containing protein [Desulfopila aestuarii]SHO47844.1 extracellular solute-binding protein, family 3 [Desulfopila aestuarii DSM 18488]
MERESKPKNYILRWLMTIMILVVAPCASLAEDTTIPIEYVYPDQSVWTTKTDAKGVLENPLLHLAKALFSELHLEWNAKPYPAGRMFERLEQGTSNFSILVRAPRLAESCIFSKKPVVFTELRVYRKGASPAITEKTDLRGKSVIVIRGYSYGGIGKFLRDPANNIAVNEALRHEAAFQMLEYGRAEYLIDYTGPSEEILIAQPISDIAHDVLDRLDVFLVLSKNYPDAENMMERMEKAVASIDVGQWGLQRP